MAGRGTDIQLGGNKDILVNNKIDNIEENKKLALESGGLLVIGTERMKVEGQITAKRKIRKTRRPWRI